MADRCYSAYAEKRNGDNLPFSPGKQQAIHFFGMC